MRIKFLIIFGALLILECVAKPAIKKGEKKNLEETKKSTKIKESEENKISSKKEKNSNSENSKKGIKTNNKVHEKKKEGKVIKESKPSKLAKISASQTQSKEEKEEKVDVVDLQSSDEESMGLSEEEIYIDEDELEDFLETEAVAEEKQQEDLKLPISGRLKDILVLPSSHRVMSNPNELIPKEKPDQEVSKNEMPVADKVMDQPPPGSSSGGDGKMKMDLNLKELDGDPTDLTVGAAAVGLMSQAVKSKGPDDAQVNAVAGFGHQIMGLVSELEKDVDDDKATWG